MDKTIENGDEVKDRITGFRGVVVGVISYLTGCDQALVQPGVSKDGSHRGGRWIDLPSLKIKQKSKINPADVTAAKDPGGPGPSVEPSRI